MDKQPPTMKWCSKLAILSIKVSIPLLTLAAVLAYIHGPILDVRFERRPLDPELIDGACPMHGEPLKEGIVLIQYGFPDLPEGYFGARRTHFPFANSRYLGGCDLKKPWIARVLFCPQCRKAEKEWKAIARN